MAAAVSEAETGAEQDAEGHPGEDRPQHPPLRWCSSTELIEVKTMVASEVPTPGGSARPDRCPGRWLSTRTGTMMMPPPTPNSPASTPGRRAQQQIEQEFHAPPGKRSGMVTDGARRPPPPADAVGPAHTRPGPQHVPDRFAWRPEHPQTAGAGANRDEFYDRACLPWPNGGGARPRRRRDLLAGGTWLG